MKIRFDCDINTYIVKAANRNNYFFEAYTNLFYFLLTAFEREFK